MSFVQCGIWSSALFGPELPVRRIEQPDWENAYLNYTSFGEIQLELEDCSI